ncbi:MAG: glucokinase [Desulfobacterales bacterium]|nr:glucokinase [Desulfobacterales bacterium]
MNTDNQISLVADIGGTNARFALIEGSGFELIEARSLICAEYPTIVDAIQAYLDGISSAIPVRGVISVAAPVTGGQIQMINHNWHFCIDACRQQLGWKSIKVLNDYTALALALPFLPENQCQKIGGGEISSNHAKAVIGPGTGLGISGVLPVAGTDTWLPLQSEGGHSSYGGLTDREIDVIRLIRKKQPHVSAESIVSGPGISLIYSALTQLETGHPVNLRPDEISELAIGGKSAEAMETLAMFCSVLGTMAGNLALTLGARGGIYIGGGILRKMVHILRGSDFRERFEQHGRLTSYLSRIPTYLIDTDYPALIGAMVALDRDYEAVGVISRAST